MTSKLSVCMIVKNESRWIEQSLSSVMNWVDEMIVVDTGSSDNTAEIAQSMGANVYHYEWDDDFSKARNYSISKATGDWILVIDADEVISKDDANNIRTLIENPTGDMYYLIQTTYCEESATLGWIPNHLSVPESQGYPGYLESPLVRLFKNSGEIYFNGCVHEHAQHNNKKIIGIQSLIRIHHYGKYSPKEVTSKKEDLYLRLGIEKCTKNPDDAHAWYELGVQYWGMNHEAEAIEAFHKSEKLDPNHIRTIIALGGIHSIKKEYPKALRYYSKVMDLDSQNIIPYLYLPTILIEMGNFKLAQDILRYGQRFAVHHPPYHINRGIVYQHLGNHRVAIECFDEALRINARETLATYNKGVSLLALQEYEKAISEFSKVLNCERVGLLAYQKITESYYSQDKSSEALRYVNEGLSLYENDPVLIYQKAVIHIRANELDKGRELLSLIKSYEHFDESGLINLKQCWALVGDTSKVSEIEKLLGSKSKDLQRVDVRIN